MDSALRHRSIRWRLRSASILIWSYSASCLELCCMAKSKLSLVPDPVLSISPMSGMVWSDLSQCEATFVSPWRLASSGPEGFECRLIRSIVFLRGVHASTMKNITPFMPGSSSCFLYAADIQNTCYPLSHCESYLPSVTSIHILADSSPCFSPCLKVHRC